MTDAIKNRISGAARTNELIDKALEPDPDGLARVDRNEMNEIVDAYQASGGGLIDGREASEAHARAVKPALADALAATRQGASDPYRVYMRSQINRDLANSGAGPRPPVPAPAESASLKGAMRVVGSMLNRGASFARDVNDAGDLAEQVLPRIAAGESLTDDDFARLKAAARDEATFTMLARRVSSLDLAAFQFLREHPQATKQQFEQHVRDSYPI